MVTSVCYLLSLLLAHASIVRVTYVVVIFMKVGAFISCCTSQSISIARVLAQFNLIYDVHQINVFSLVVMWFRKKLVAL